MTTLFVSDLHLDASRPAATDCFLRFLAGQARDAGTLYILGDLFEAWTGDDAAGPHEQAILAALRRYTGTGRSCGFLRGNRDFLVGQRFAAETGAILLPDEALVDVGGTRALLMHGDTLCTDDHAYQRYRRLVHRPGVQALYLRLPAPLRTDLAAWARRRSRAANAGKPAAIMDVSQSAVTDALRRHGSELLIHGHTHRPAVHALEVDGRSARRIVLGDWYTQGSVLQWAAAGPELRTLAFG
ncbi:MAG: UDP-2,3-diacylglucosamine diphosphatase [Chromatiales bacterium]|nr:UDP-2,3-diacylglucosamine diphosphatase [Chromatiales bacterium]